ncbi:MAG: hypothetical protein J6J36_01775 [Clostridia bacterium]|nr:hypothetical protein [Clostridia bacterium]
MSDDKRAEANTKSKINSTSVYLNPIRTYRYVVPKEVCPLDVMATMGDKLEEAWVYLSTEALNKLQETGECSFVDGGFSMEWPATPEYPRTQLVVKNDSPCWWSVVSIRASDIPYADWVTNPKTIIFITVE